MKYTILIMLVITLGLGLGSCRTDQDMSTPSRSTTSVSTIKITPTDTQTPTKESPILVITSTPSILVTEEAVPTPTKWECTLIPRELCEYIGIQYQDPPNGIVEGFGMVISSEGPIDYAISGMHKGDFQMLWFDKLVRRDSEGKPYWEVLDILPLPSLVEEDERLIPGGCLFNHELDPEILVIALLDEEAYNTRYIKNENILHAWRMNRSKGVFEQISTEGIECHADMSMDW